MATLKSTDAWKIKIYADDHAPPHFHMLTVDGESLVDIATLQEREKGPGCRVTLGRRASRLAGAGVE